MDRQPMHTNFFRRRGGRCYRKRGSAKDSRNVIPGRVDISQRPKDVESAFGNLKRHKGFTRFMLRGMDKVAIETGLLATAMNLKKLASAMAQQARKAATEVLNGLE